MSTKFKSKTINTKNLYNYFDAKQISHYKVIIWTLGRIYQVKEADVLHAEGRFLTILDKWLTSEGPQGLDRLKFSYQFCKRSEVCDASAMYDGKLWVARKTIRSHLPARLHCLARPYSKRKTRMFVLSLLRMYTLVSFIPKPKLASVTDPYKGAWKGQEIVDLAELCRSIHRGSRSGEINFDGWFTSAKGSPNGWPAYSKSWKDWHALKKIPSVLKAIRTLAIASNNRTLINYIDKADSKSDDSWGLKFDVVPFNPKSSTHKSLLKSKSDRLFRIQGHRFVKNPVRWDTMDTQHSKLSFIAEGGGKTRTIALGDLYSQTALKPIHMFFMGLLRRTSSDCTFNQERGVKFLQRWTERGVYMTCYDLKDCTDRFPILFQRKIVESYLGPDVSRAWETIMVNRPFWHTCGEPPIHYSVGQPMGFLSSWAVMAFSHHAVVHLAARREGINFPNKYYRILGDDIVFAHRRLALCYQRFMVYFLGVDMSPSKEISGKGIGEFCKRLYKDGAEVFEIPPKQIYAMRNYPISAPEVIRSIERRKPTGLTMLDWVPLIRHKTRSRALKLLLSPFSHDYSDIPEYLLELWGVSSIGELQAFELSANHGTKEAVKKRFPRPPVKGKKHIPKASPSRFDELNEFYRFAATWYICKDMYFSGPAGAVLFDSSKDVLAPTLGDVRCGDGFICWDPIVEPRCLSPVNRVRIPFLEPRSFSPYYVEMSKRRSRLLTDFIRRQSQNSDLTKYFGEVAISNHISKLADDPTCVELFQFR